MRIASGILEPDVQTMVIRLKHRLVDDADKGKLRVNGKDEFEIGLFDVSSKSKLVADLAKQHREPILDGKCESKHTDD